MPAPFIDLIDMIEHSARRCDLDTAQQAGAANHKRRAIDRARVLEMHRRFPAGLNDFELATLLGGQQTSLGKRRGELRDAGYIVDSGLRRPSKPGGRSMAIVWRLI